MAKKAPELYLLQNLGCGFLGNSPLFWHKSNSGYTQWIDEARVWTREEVEKQIRGSRGTHRWKRWPLSLINKVARRTVDIQGLDRLAEKKAEQKERQRAKRKTTAAEHGSSELADG